MAKCIRCGKPCGSGENMCDECKAWFQEKTGGSVVSGVKNITSKPNKEVQADSSRIDTTDNEEELYLCLWNAKYNDSEIGWTFNDQRNDIVGAFPSISGKVGYIIEFEE